MNNFKKGFITIAIGEYYRYLAKNLVRTYRLNGGEDYPFAVVTDIITPELREYFDEIILDDNKLQDGYLYKLKLPHYTPFNETIFIDTDCLVINDIAWYWEFFGGVDFGVFGINIIAEREKPFHLFDVNKAIIEFGITNLPGFNGGIYYFKQNGEAQKVFETAKSLIYQYDELGMPRFTNIKAGTLRMGDEPLFALSMAINGVKAIEDKQKKGMWNLNGCRNMFINLEKKICSYHKHDIDVTPSIVHFGTDNTKRFHYKKEELRLKYITEGRTNSSLLKIGLILKKTFYILRVQFFRMVMLKPSLFDLTPVHDFNERRLLRQFQKIAKFLKISG